MKPVHRIVCLFNLVVAGMLAAGPAQAQDGVPVSPSQESSAGAVKARGASATVNDRAHEKLLLEGIAVLKAGQPQRAIDEYFDKIITTNNKQFAALDMTIYAARGQAEALAYLVRHAADTSKKTDAVVVSSSAAYAHYMKGFALVDLKREDEAKVELERALALSPDNGMFLDELAGWYLRRRDWDHALENFQHAERTALLSPEAKNLELGAAWRGIGYVYVEQHKLDDAEAMYKKCLELDANDNKARAELGYVRQQRAKAG